MADGKKGVSPFDTIPNMTFEEYRNQEIIETNDGAFFDALDEMFGIEPGTDCLKVDADKRSSRSAESELSL